MTSNWHGLLKIESIQHIRNGNVIWEESNVHNTLHQLGEAFLLTACFSNDGTIVPANYYFGLDSRDSISINDTISSLVDEPISGGYARLPISSSTGFTITSISGIYRAVTPTLIFTGAGSGFGPVKNLFMVTTSDNTGTLISSAPLSSTLTLSSGDSVNLKMSLQLHDCP